MNSLTNSQFWPGRNVVITGATGFIGSHLVRSLRPLCPVLTAITRTEADVRDKKQIKAWFEKTKPEIVFHLAGTRGGGRKDAASQAAECLEINALGTAHVLEAALEFGVARIVMIGSAAEYGAQRGPWHEELPLCPSSSYGISRAAATQTALTLHRAQDLPVVVLRAFTVYGPGQPSSMFIAQAMESLAYGIPFTPRDGAHRQDLVFVSDVVEALLCAAQTPQIEGKVINIGSGCAPTLNFVTAQIRALCAGGTVNNEEETAAPDAPRAIVERAGKYLGWHARTPLSDGLAQTLASFRVAPLTQLNP